MLGTKFDIASIGATVHCSLYNNKAIEPTEDFFMDPRTRGIAPCCVRILAHGTWWT